MSTGELHQVVFFGEEGKRMFSGTFRQCIDAAIEQGKRDQHCLVESLQSRVQQLEGEVAKERDHNKHLEAVVEKCKVALLSAKFSVEFAAENRHVFGSFGRDCNRKLPALTAALAAIDALKPKSS